MEYGKLENDWQRILQPEFESEYFLKIKKFLSNERQLGKVIFPPNNLIFEAFRKTTFTEVKVVILGQDPYHQPGLANGLSFSVNDGVKIPPSLRNIFKELSSDLSIGIPENGNLQHWCRQGVFLLNTCLTVEMGKPASHKAIGWERFTSYILKYLSTHKSKIVFLGWGNQAIDKISQLDSDNHYFLKSSHPIAL